MKMLHKINSSFAWKMCLCLIGCFILGLCMNQYKLSMPIYTGITAVFFAVFLIGYYFAVNRWKERKTFFLLILLNTILFFIAFIFFKELVLVFSDFSILLQVGIAVSISMIVATETVFVSISYRKGKIRIGEVVYLIIYLSFLFRAMYALFNPIGNVSRQHDTIVFTNGGGHLGYIWYIWAYGKIPSVDPRTLWEFYQPPFYYLICGYWVKIYTFLRVPALEAAENIQLFSLFCVTGTAIALDEIIRIMGGKRQRILAAIMFALCPLFTYLAGSVNNDSLLLLLFFLSVYTIILWYERETLRLLIIAAVCTGLTVMTKISGSLIAVPILFLFVMKLITKKDLKKLCQYILFGLISVPIGLWWNLRNTLRFQMPFVYFHEASRESVQFIPNYSVSQRFFDLKGQLNHPYIEILNSNKDVDHNIFVSTLKTTVFTSSSDVMISIVTQIIGWILLILTIIVLVWMVIDYFFSIFRSLKKRNDLMKMEYCMVWILTVFSQVGFYLYFNLAHTFVHNMHARYIMPAIVSLIILWSFMEHFNDNKVKKTNRIIQIGMVFYGSVLVSFIMLISLMTCKV